MPPILPVWRSWPFRVTGGHRRCHQSIFETRTTEWYRHRLPLATFWKSWDPHNSPRGRINFWTLTAHISYKRCEIATKLLLFTNRKSYTAFRTVPNLLTPGDLERSNQGKPLPVWRFWPFRVTGGHRRCYQSIFRTRFPVRYDEKTYP